MKEAALGNNKNLNLYVIRFMEQQVKTNSLKAWILAARPKTISAAAVPVMIGVAFALRKTLMMGTQWITVDDGPFRYTGQEMTKVYLDGHFNWVPALLCLLFAWVMQIDSNFVNDYFDFKSGRDNENRLGPKRACAEGWITAKAMKWGIGITTLLGCLVGLPLISYGGMEMVLVGIACVVFCFLYTTVLSSEGLGDVLVLMFFGIVPVCCTYYVCMPSPIQMPTGEVFAASIACGLVIDTLLMVNNFRDRDNDKKAGKNTLVVRIGESNSKWVYQHLGFFGFTIMAAISIIDMLSAGSILPIFLIFVVYALLHAQAYRAMFRINKGRELNKVLGMTARNIFIFGITSVITILFVLLVYQGSAN